MKINPTQKLPVQDNVIYKPTEKERRTERSIIALYLFFFIFWCIGLIIGLHPNTLMWVWFMPLWFTLSCFVAYAVTCLGLAWIIARFFK